MHTVGFLALLAIVVLGGAYLLSGYMHRVYDGRRTWLSPVFGPVERLIYRALGIDAERDMTALQYTRAVLMFSAAGLPRPVHHPADPGPPAVQPDLAQGRAP